MCHKCGLLWVTSWNIWFYREILCLNPPAVSLFAPHCSSSIRYINEKPAIDSGRYLYMDRLHAVVTIFAPWLSLPGEEEMTFL